MQFPITINQNIDFQFKLLRKEKDLVDCIISSDGYEFQCHQIILSIMSQWFCSYFNEHKSNELIQVIDLPYNPHNCFPIVLNFIYHEEISVDITNLAPLISICKYYKFDSCMPYFFDSFEKAISTETVLYLSKEFSDLELFDEACHPKMLKSLLDIYNNQPDSFDNILSSICYKQLAAILSSKDLNTMSIDLKLDYVDKYFQIHNATEQDRNVISQIWTTQASDNEIHYFLNHGCNWLPFSISRRIVNQVISSRRTIIDKFKSDHLQAEKAISHWYPFSWLTAIAKCEISICSERSYVQPSINFISTLGDLTDIIPSDKIGLIYILATRPLSSLFSSSNIISDKGYYMSIDCKKTFESTPPFIMINFGPGSHFLPTRIVINSRIPTNLLKEFQNTLSEIPNFKVAPVSCILEAIKTKEKCLEKTLEFHDGIADYPIETTQTFSQFKITMNEPSSNGGYILRISKIEIYGRFCPRDNSE